MWNRKPRKNKDNSEAINLSAQEAYDCALHLLSYRDYSEARMRERLHEKGADAEVTEATLEKLRHYGFLNDERYAAKVYEYWLAKKYYGRQHLLAELAKQGVPDALQQNILEAFTPEIEEERALAAGEIFVERNRKKISQQPREKIYAAACRFLAARGFSGAYARIIFEKIRPSADI